MSAGLFADPDAMESAVERGAEAADGLLGARTLLDFARESVVGSVGTGLAFGPSPLRHKTETMVRQWQMEFDEIAGLLAAYEAVVHLAAQAYRTRDAELAEALADFAAGELSDGDGC